MGREIGIDPPRILHPCICRVFGIGVADQKPYVALELLEGT
jgi:hypothetical protein